MKKHILVTIIIISILIIIYTNLLSLSPKIAIMLGQNINKTDINGNTALIWAVQKENINLIKKLISAGADVNIADIYGNNPLMFAVKEKNLDITKELIKAGANVNAQNNEGKTALELTLIFTSENKTIDITKELINAGADVNIADNSGFMPFMFACDTGDLSLVNLLIEAGANDKSTQIIKNINELMDKKQFSSAAKILNKNANIIMECIKRILLNRIIDGSIENKKFAISRTIVKESNMSKEEKTNFMSQIDSIEEPIIDNQVKSLLGNFKFTSAIKIVENSTLSRQKKDDMILHIKDANLTMCLFWYNKSQYNKFDLTISREERDSTISKLNNHNCRKYLLEYWEKQAQINAATELERLKALGYL